MNDQLISYEALCDRPKVSPARQVAKEIIVRHRLKEDREYHALLNVGAVIGESYVHQVYVPSRLWALVNSKIIKPEVKLAEVLYPRFGWLKPSE